MTEIIDVAAFTAFERAGWDRILDGYHRFMGPVTSATADPLLDAAGVAAGHRILDVGTGPGYAADRGAQVVGVDLSPRIVALARALNPTVDFRVADAAALSFADATFDAVVAGFLLPHLGDHERALAELCRVLRPGGTLALSTWDRPERVPLLGLMVEAVEQVGARPPADVPAGPPFFRYSDAGTLTGLLDAAGLVDVTVERSEYVHRVTSTDALWDRVLSGSVRTSALVAGQPPAVRAAIRAAFDQLAAPYWAGRALRLPVSVLVAAGRLRSTAAGQSSAPGLERLSRLVAARVPTPAAPQAPQRRKSRKRPRCRAILTATPPSTPAPRPGPGSGLPRRCGPKHERPGSRKVTHASPTVRNRRSSYSTTAQPGKGRSRRGLGGALAAFGRRSVSRGCRQVRLREEGCVGARKLVWKGGVDIARLCGTRTVMPTPNAEMLDPSGRAGSGTPARLPHRPRTW